MYNAVEKGNYIINSMYFHDHFQTPSSPSCLWTPEYAIYFSILILYHLSQDSLSWFPILTLLFALSSHKSYPYLLVTNHYLHHIIWTALLKCHLFSFSSPPPPSFSSLCLPHSSPSPHHNPKALHMILTMIISMCCWSHTPSLLYTPLPFSPSPLPLIPIQSPLHLPWSYLWAAGLTNHLFSAEVETHRIIPVLCNNNKNTPDH